MRSEPVEGRVVAAGLVWLEGRFTVAEDLFCDDERTCDDGLAADEFLFVEDERLTELLELLDEVDVPVDRDSLRVCASASDIKAVNANIVSIAASVVLIFPIIVMF